jgi:hypothetical protein
MLWAVLMYASRVVGPGGNGALPLASYLCLEPEGSPVEFKNIRIRELPWDPSYSFQNE